uniref:Battenin n=1 Tax=Angiostrongylus cantonensis TaxID=6313 RepID=A0A0K0DKI2_ANGCA
MQRITTRICSPISVGVVLIWLTVPGLTLKLVSPFFLHRIPYGSQFFRIRHFTICSLQVTALVMTALAESTPLALFGVSIASICGGLGETTYLGLAGHYSKLVYKPCSRHTISTWSSGTGAAAVIGSFLYAGLTDARLVALSSTQAILVMLVMPAIFAFTYVSTSPMS